MKINEVNKLNPEASEAVTKVIVEEFRYLAGSMLSNPEEWFDSETMFIPEDLNVSETEMWTKEIVSDSIQRAMLIFANIINDKNKG